MWEEQRGFILCSYKAGKDPVLAALSLPWQRCLGLSDGRTTQPPCVVSPLDLGRARCSANRVHCECAECQQSRALPPSIRASERVPCGNMGSSLIHAEVMMRMLIRARVRMCSPPLSTSFSEIPWRSHASIRSGHSDPLQCVRSRSNHEAAECVTDSGCSQWPPGAHAAEQTRAMISGFYWLL